MLIHDMIGHTCSITCHLFIVLNSSMFQFVGVPLVSHLSGLALELACTASLGCVSCFISATTAVTDMSMAAGLQLS